MAWASSVIFVLSSLTKLYLFKEVLNPLSELIKSCTAGFCGLSLAGIKLSTTRDVTLGSSGGASWGKLIFAIKVCQVFVDFV